MSEPTITSHTIDAAVAATASKATYAGAGISVWGWLLSSEFAVLFGAVLGTLGLLVNVYYTRKQDQREEEQHRLSVEQHNARMAEYQKDRKQ